MGFVAFALVAEGTVIVLNHLSRTCCIHFLNFTFVPQYNEDTLPHQKTELDPIYFLKNICVFICLWQVLVAAGRIFSCSMWYLVPWVVQGSNPGPLPWEHGVSATEALGKSLDPIYLMGPKYSPVWIYRHGKYSPCGGLAAFQTPFKALYLQKLLGSLERSCKAVIFNPWQWRGKQTSGVESLAQDHTAGLPIRHCATSHSKERAIFHTCFCFNI